MVCDNGGLFDQIFWSTVIFIIKVIWSNINTLDRNNIGKLRLSKFEKIAVFYRVRCK